MARRKISQGDDLFRLGFEEPLVRAGERPFVKDVNFFTGLGKTYWAAALAVKALTEGVIPVFIAPYRSLVNGFCNDVADHDARLRAERGNSPGSNSPVPIHLLYSRDAHQNDRTFFQAVLHLHQWVTGDPSLVEELRAKKADGGESWYDELEELRRKALFCAESDFHGMSSSDDGYYEIRERFRAQASTVITAADRLTQALVGLAIDARDQGKDRASILSVRAVDAMLARLHPLQRFLDHPGVIVATTLKSTVGQQVYIDDPKLGRKRWVSFDTLHCFSNELNAEGSALGKAVFGGRPVRALTIIDEEESAYWFLFKKRKSVVNSEGRHDLNIVVSEFFAYFDLRWPLAFEVPDERGVTVRTLAMRVYENLEKFAEVSPAVVKELKRQKRDGNAEYIPMARQIEIFRDTLEEAYPGLFKSRTQWTDEYLADILRELVDSNDTHNDFRRFREKARVLAALRRYIDTLEGLSNYDAYRRLVSLVVGKKYFTMNRCSYGELLDQPNQTFFDGHSNVLDTEFLRRVELLHDTAEQTVQLVYREDVEKSPEKSRFSLFNYLELILFIARCMNATGRNQVKFSQQDLVRYPNLARFRSEIRKLFEGRNLEEAFKQDLFGDELLSEEFFYSGTKSVVTLMESKFQPDEYNVERDVSLTVTISSMRDTPEQDLSDALGRNNGIFIMSATGGLTHTSSGAFNRQKVRRLLQQIDGYYEEMTPAELTFVKEQAGALRDQRNRKVTIFDDAQPEGGFPVSADFRALRFAFQRAYPYKNELGYQHLNSYKKAEIDGLVATLDVLLSSDVRSGFVLCQTINRIKESLINLAKSEGSGVTCESSKERNLFLIAPLAGGEPVLVILYEAARFQKREANLFGLDEDDDAGQLSPELVEALDITHKKVLMWSAYASASRGLNFVVTQNGIKKDFELFCLLNDPFYTEHTRTKSRGFSMENFQSYLQVIRDDEEKWPSMTVKGLLSGYSRDQWKRLRPEHFVDITRTAFQALGRGERCPTAETPTQQMFISGQVAQMIHLGTRIVPELALRASPAQRAVLEAIVDRNRSVRIFSSIQARKAHTIRSLELAAAFRKFTSGAPVRFRSDPQVRRTWTYLFDDRMFTDPEAYLANLRRKDVPASFVDGAYFALPAKAEPFTKRAKVNGKTERVITDADDAEDTYNWVDAIAPGGLSEHLSETGKRLMRAGRAFASRQEIDSLRLCPQPWFIDEIMKGYLAERELESFVDQQFKVLPGQLDTGDRQLRYLNVIGHPLEASIFQVFDYYLEVEGRDELIAIDVKNWSWISDFLLTDELREIAVEKHERISKLFPDKTVRTVYLNLRGALKHLVERRERGSIRFMSLYVHVGGKWMPNQNLVGVLLGQ